MDKIWYRNPSKSEVNGRCGGDEKTNDHAEPAKVERQIFFFFFKCCVDHFVLVQRLVKLEKLTV